MFLYFKMDSSLVISITICLELTKVKVPVYITLIIHCLKCVFSYKNHKKVHFCRNVDLSPLWRIGEKSEVSAARERSHYNILCRVTVEMHYSHHLILLYIQYYMTGSHYLFVNQIQHMVYYSINWQSNVQFNIVL